MYKTTIQRSTDLFASGFYCAEAILMAYCEHYDIKSDLIPKIATGFCSGLARTSQICGAATGAILALNLRYGRTDPQTSVDQNYQAIQKFLTQFENKFGSTNCMELTGCDFNTDEGQNKFKANNTMEQCSNYVKEAMHLLMSICEPQNS
jgi:C_GCAxxG_C_C family probable redox protein